MPCLRWGCRRCVCLAVAAVAAAAKQGRTLATDQHLRQAGPTTAFASTPPPFPFLCHQTQLSFPSQPHRRLVRKFIGVWQSTPQLPLVFQGRSCAICRGPGQRGKHQPRGLGDYPGGHTTTQRQSPSGTHKARIEQRIRAPSPLAGRRRTRCKHVIRPLGPNRSALVALSSWFQ